MGRAQIVTVTRQRSANSVLPGPDQRSNAAGHGYLGDPRDTHRGFAVGITAGLVMIALGAILKFALPWSWLGVVNIAAVGVILMIVGAVGLVVALIIWGP